MAIAAITLFWTSCSESSEVGVDIIEGGTLGVNYDTLGLESVTIRQDSVLSPSYKNYTYTYPLGNFEDPVFGKTSSGFYMQFLPGSSYRPADIANATVDSVVLSMRYDSVSIGNIKQTRQFEVYRLTEDLATQDYYSNKTFAVGATPIASKTFIPRNNEHTPIKDSVKIIAYGDTTNKTILTLLPHLRVRLDNAIGEEILRYDSTQINVNAEFIKKFKGLHIKPTSDDKGMINFRLTKFDGTNTSYNALTNISIYYRNSKGQRNIMALYSGNNCVKSVNYKYTPSSILKSAINNKNTGDSVVYLQGMNGADIKLNVPNLKKLKDANLVINKAELTIYVKPTPDGFITPPQLLIREKYIGGFEDHLVGDVIFGSNNNFEIFGGKPVKVTINGQTLLRYRFNLSYHTQKMFDFSNSVSSNLYITLDKKTGNAHRAVIYGAKHPKFPMEMKVYYSKI